MKIINQSRIFNYILTFVGLFAISYYIWFRFIRERLPRDIPFQPTLFILLFLMFICGIYLYVLLRLFIPKPPHKYIIKLLTIYYEVYKPVIEFEKNLRSQKVIKYIIDKIFYLCSIFIDRYVLYYEYTNIAFYILINIFPKIILLIIFCIDIFYFHQFKFFYYFIGLGLIPLLFQYLCYIIKEELEVKIKYLDERFESIYIAEEGKEDKDELYNYVMFPSSLETTLAGGINTRYFIDFQSDALTLYCDLFKYDCVETIEAREEYKNKHNIKTVSLLLFAPRQDEISCILAQKYFYLMPQVINISAYFKECEWNKGDIEDINKKTMIILVIVYVICWIYILTVTFVSKELLLFILEIIRDNIRKFKR